MEENVVNNFSLIESVNTQQVSMILQKISQFQTIVQKSLKEDHDFGKIPGCGNKPTLLKPGAEKILMLMGVTSVYELVERVQDYDKGFFAYTVKCVLSRNGSVITEGVGHCNTREKKYASERQDPYTLANTCLKMAKKRAQVDATLTIASLSEIFTQDIEDFADSGNYNKPQQHQNTGQAPQRGNLSEAQLKRFYAIVKASKAGDQVAKTITDSRFNDRIVDGKVDWSRVTRQEYDAICKLFESGDWKTEFERLMKEETIDTTAKEVNLDDLPL